MPTTLFNFGDGEMTIAEEFLERYKSISSKCSSCIADFELFYDDLFNKSKNLQGEWFQFEDGSNLYRCGGKMSVGAALENIKKAVDLV